MSRTERLKPGTIVSKSGKYKCEVCGGLASAMASFYVKSGISQSTAQRLTKDKGTVKFFTEGGTFTECPICEPDTLWTLVRESISTFEAASAPRFESAVYSNDCDCDICNNTVIRPGGYLLTTRDIVSSPAYWRHYCQMHNDELASLGVSSFADFYQNPTVRDSCTETIARQSSPWLVCGDCIQMFRLDREQAHSYAISWWNTGKRFKPPGTGPSPIGAVNMGDGGDFSSDADIFPGMATSSTAAGGITIAVEPSWIKPMAIASLILAISALPASIFGCGLLFPLIAVVLGAISLLQARKFNSTRNTQLMALVGLIFGGILTIILAIAVAAALITQGS